ncbi:LLM class flavin-dependent oxidoreductase [Gordonia sp. CPCC 206044]|uniref:LLM class flavin-dependent oxidoreductase n=1 Tax=Gordonia sp. CPCC 206044 TaxID=3140793 RepID=UPI003AF3F95E
MTASGPPHLAVALSGAGWHPLAWREPDARPAELLSARYWIDVVGAADRAGIELITIADTLRRRPPTTDGIDRPISDLAAGHLDSTLIAARVAPTTRFAGIAPSIVATHTEPFHTAKAIATLDFVSHGRAGVIVDVAGSAPDARLFGRRTLPADARVRDAELFDEAADYVEVLRRLWDSWEDDAEIRDVATGRFVDRDKLHYIDFAGKYFSVRGPSITPRPPQGQPIVAVTAAGTEAVGFAGAAADIAFTGAHDPASAAQAAGDLRRARDAAGRAAEPLHVFADVLVHLDDRAAAAQDRRTRLDDLLGTPYTGGVPVFSGTAESLADLVVALTEPGTGVTGVRLRPATIPHDLDQITRHLIPELQRRKLFRTPDGPTSLRGRLGLATPISRYAPATAGAGR